jgi:dienelactone hydrolase
VRQPEARFPDLKLQSRIAMPGCRRLLPILATLVATALAPAAEPTLFDYDRSAPLGVKEVAVETRGTVTVRDLTFIGVDAPVKAYVVAPTQPGSYAAILYVHWLGEPATTNRTEFLNEAVTLAGRGVVSVLVDAMWANPAWWDGRKPETDFAGGVRQVIELRRAVDLLLAQPGVDPARTALVAHDFGAMFGAVMAATDQRLHAYVFLAPTPRLADWYLFNVKPASVEEYKKTLAPLDPIDAVARLAPAPVFYQFALHDKYVPAPRPTQFFDATRPRKTIAMYDADHDLSPPEVAADRLAWLAKELRLP